MLEERRRSEKPRTQPEAQELGATTPDHSQAAIGSTPVNDSQDRKGYDRTMIAGLHVLNTAPNGNKPSGIDDSIGIGYSVGEHQQRIDRATYEKLLAAVTDHLRRYIGEDVNKLMVGSTNWGSGINLYVDEQEADSLYPALALPPRAHEREKQRESEQARSRYFDAQRELVSNLKHILESGSAESDGRRTEGMSEALASLLARSGLTIYTIDPKNPSKSGTLWKLEPSRIPEKRET